MPGPFDGSVAHPGEKLAAAYFRSPTKQGFPKDRQQLEPICRERPNTSIGTIPLRWLEERNPAFDPDAVLRDIRQAFPGFDDLHW